MISPYEALANAVVLQAVKDYRAAKRKLKRRPDNESAQRDLKECEIFFKSRHFNTFTDLDGKALLHRLEEEDE